MSLIGHNPQVSEEASFLSHSGNLVDIGSFQHCTKVQFQLRASRIESANPTPFQKKKKKRYSTDTQAEPLDWQFQVQWFFRDDW